MRALFICSRNRMRSPTGEAVFAQWPNVETDSAGLALDAEVVLTAEQIDWADVIFVMERVHRQRLSQRFGPQLRGKRVVVVDDVMTSGASLHAAAHVLRQAGATHISALVLARTDLGGSNGQ